MTSTFYTIKEFSADGDSLAAEVGLHPEAEIFKGHFPQKAVLPGVCQILIFREMISRHAGKELRIGELKEIKFLAPILPDSDPLLSVRVQIKSSDGATLKIEGGIETESGRKTKIKAIFV